MRFRELPTGSWFVLPPQIERILRREGCADRDYEKIMISQKLDACSFRGLSTPEYGTITLTQIFPTIRDPDPEIIEVEMPPALRNLAGFF